MEAIALKPPPDGDIILSNHYIAAIIVMTIVAVLIAWLRIYVRMFVSRNTGWDDWTMFAASLITVVTNAFLMSAYHYGLGRHIYYLKPDDISQAFMWLWAAEPTNLFAVFLVRLSISLFFLRLVPPKKIYLWVIWGTIAGLTASDIFISVNYFFECRPIRRVWQPETPGVCFSQGVTSAATWLYQAVSIISDVILLIIPICLFWRLRVRLQTKLALIFICCLGIFTCVCAIVKTVLLQNLFSTDPDKTWIDKQLCLWAPMELCVGMVCGSIPALRPLFMSDTKSSQGSYRKFEKPIKLSSLRSENHEPPSVPPKTLNSNLPPTKAKPYITSSSASEEQIMGSYDDQQIRRTFEVEVSNEAVGTPGIGREGYKRGWDMV